MSDLLQLVQGSEVQETVKRYEGRVHHYGLNLPGLYLLMTLAGIVYISAAILWIGGYATTLPFQIALGVCLALGTILSLTVTYWNSVSQKKFVATSDAKLMVGNTERMWVIDWSILDAEKLGLKDMAVNRAGGRLQIHAAGEVIHLLLFSPFAMLNDYQEFMFTMLTRTAGDEEE